MAAHDCKRLHLSWLVLVLFLVSEASADGAVRGKSEQSGLWELPVHGSACDPYTPVCAEGSVSYKSECHALAADAHILMTGACDEGIRKPAACTVNCFRADPCGATEAKCAGVEVGHEGYCDIWNGGAGAKGLAAQSLQLVHLVWLVLAGLFILFGLA